MSNFIFEAWKIRPTNFWLICHANFWLKRHVNFWFKGPTTKGFLLDFLTTMSTKLKWAICITEQFEAAVIHWKVLISHICTSFEYTEKNSSRPSHIRVSKKNYSSLWCKNATYPIVNTSFCLQILRCEQYWASVH